MVVLKLSKTSQMKDHFKGLTPLTVSCHCELLRDECLGINVKQPSKLHKKGGPLERSKCRQENCQCIPMLLPM